MDFSDSEVEQFIYSCINMIPIVAGCCIDALSRYLSSINMAKLNASNAQAIGIGITIASAVFWNVNIKIIYVPTLSDKEDIGNLSTIISERLNSPTILLTDEAYRVYRRREMAKLFKIILYELSQIAPLLLGEKFIIDGEIAGKLFNFIMKFSSYSLKNMKNIAEGNTDKIERTVHDTSNIVTKTFSIDIVDRKILEFFFKNLRESNGKLKYIIVQSRINNAIRNMLIRTIIEGDPKLIEIICKSSLSKEIENSIDYLIDKFEISLTLGKDVRELIEKNKQLLEKIRKYEEEIITLKKRNEELENILKIKKEELIAKLFQEKHVKITVLDGLLKKRKRMVIVRAPLYVLLLIKNLMKEYDGYIPIKLIRMLEQHNLAKIVKYCE